MKQTYETTLDTPTLYKFQYDNSINNPLKQTTCRKYHKNDKYDQCYICQDKFNCRSIIRQIQPCKHIFCEDCIIKWIATNKRTCPICRQIF